MSKLLTIALIFMVGSSAAAQMPVAALPRTYIDATWNLPQGGTTWAAHTAAQFTSALQVAAPGDIVLLDAGATYSGYFNVPAKSNSNKKWIYVMSSAYAKLPAPGIRVSPANAVNLPKIVTPGATSALRFADGANHWRFVGIAASDMRGLFLQVQGARPDKNVGQDNTLTGKQSRQAGASEIFGFSLEQGFDGWFRHFAHGVSRQRIQQQQP